MSEGPPTTRPDRAELEAAIDALLAEIDATCARFEKPEDADDDGDLDEYTQAMNASVATPGVASEAAAAAALNSAESAAEALLGEAADRLVESLEQGVQAAGVEAAAGEAPEAEPEPETEAAPASNQQLLDQAVGTLLDELGPQAGTEAQADAPQTGTEAQADAPPEPAATTLEEADADDAARIDQSNALLDDAALDALLDGSFESATGETVDTDGLDTRPDPALMLDAEAEAAAPSEPAEPEIEQAAEPSAAEPKPMPKTTAVGVAAVPAAPSQPRLDRLLAWARPRAAAVWRKVFDAFKPVGARALIVLSRPLENKPPAVRDSIGWVALWTVFLGLCVWAYAALRPADAPANDGQGSRVVSAEPAPGP